MSLVVFFKLVQFMDYFNGMKDPINRLSHSLNHETADAVMLSDKHY